MFRVQSSGFRVQGPGFRGRVQSLGFRVYSTVRPPPSSASTSAPASSSMRAVPCCPCPAARWSAVDPSCWLAVMSAPAGAGSTERTACAVPSASHAEREREERERDQRQAASARSLRSPRVRKKAELPSHWVSSPPLSRREREAAGPPRYLPPSPLA